MPSGLVAEDDRGRIIRSITALLRSSPPPPEELLRELLHILRDARDDGSGAREGARPKSAEAEARGSHKHWLRQAYRPPNPAPARAAKQAVLPAGQTAAVKAWRTRASDTAFARNNTEVDRETEERKRRLQMAHARSGGSLFVGMPSAHAGEGWAELYAEQRGYAAAEHQLRAEAVNFGPRRTPAVPGYAGFSGRGWVGAAEAHEEEPPPAGTEGRARELQELQAAAECAIGRQGSAPRPAAAAAPPAAAADPRDRPTMIAHLQAVLDGRAPRADGGFNTHADLVPGGGTQVAGGVLKGGKTATGKPRSMTVAPSDVQARGGKANSEYFSKMASRLREAGPPLRQNRADADFRFNSPADFLSANRQLDGKGGFR